MNLIMRAHSVGGTYEAAEKLVNYYRPAHLFLLLPGNLESFSAEVSATEVYEIGSAVNDIRQTACYADKVCSLEQLPLDVALLEAFEPYLDTAMSIMGRMVTRFNGAKVPTYEERLQLLYGHITYWNTVIQQYNIDCYINFHVPHMNYDFVIYALCKLHNIPTYLMYTTKVPGYHYLLTDIKEPCPEIVPICEGLKKKYQDVSEQEIPLPDDFAKEYKKYTDPDADWTPFQMLDPVPHVLAPTQETTSGRPYPSRFSTLVKRLYLKGPAKILQSFFQGWIPAKVNRIKGGFRERKIQKNFREVEKASRQYHRYWNKRCTEVDLFEKFIYVPLHLQPECNSDPMGGYFGHQELMVAMLASALPDDVYLYVKENPKQTARFRSKAFVDRLADIPGVRLVRRDFDTYSLLDNCIAVASLTGTALWEGLFKHKPGLMFGYYITQYAPGIYHVQTNEQCVAAVRNILRQGATHSVKDLKLFMLAMSQVSFKGKIFVESKFPYDLELDMRNRQIFDAYTRVIDKTLSNKSKKERIVES